MEEKERLYTQKEVDKLLLDKIEIKEFNRISKQLESKEEEISILKKMPIIKDEYNKMGGKKSIYEDWFNKHKAELLSLEGKDIAKAIKKTTTTTSYAFETDGVQAEDIDKSVNLEDVDAGLLV